MSTKPVDDIINRRLETLTSMLRRCHAAIRCDDNERLARGQATRWSVLDRQAQEVLDGKEPTP